MNRLDSQHCDPELVIPGGELALLGAAEFAERCGGCFYPQDVEGDLFQPREVVGSVVFTDGGDILAEIDVEDPVQSVLNPPVSAWGGSESLGSHETGRNVVTAF